MPNPDARRADATESPRVPGAGPPGPDTGLHGTDPQTDEMLAARLRLAVTRLHRRLRQHALAGISPSQESALATVSRLERPTLGELAQAEQVQPPTMTRIVAEMESAGFVVRLVDAGDRRVSRVTLTPSGRDELARIRTLKNAYLAHQIGQLAPDVRGHAGALAELLESLVEER